MTLLGDLFLPLGEYVFVEILGGYIGGAAGGNIGGRIGMFWGPTGMVYGTIAGTLIGREAGEYVAQEIWDVAFPDPVIQATVVVALSGMYPEKPYDYNLLI